MEYVVELGAVEDSMMPKVMLKPTCLCLARDNQTGRYRPGQPVVPKVPEDPPAQEVDDNDVRKQGHKEPRTDFEHPLKKKFS